MALNNIALLNSLLPGNIFPALSNIALGNPAHNGLLPWAVFAQTVSVFVQY